MTFILMFAKVIILILNSAKANIEQILPGDIPMVICAFVWCIFHGKDAWMYTFRHWGCVIVNHYLSFSCICNYVVGGWGQYHIASVHVMQYPWSMEIVLVYWFIYFYNSENNLHGKFRKFKQIALRNNRNLIVSFYLLFSTNIHKHFDSMYNNICRKSCIVFIIWIFFFFFLQSCFHVSIQYHWLCKTFINLYPIKIGFDHIHYLLNFMLNVTSFRHFVMWKYLSLTVERLHS